jgi:hypothetical protein
VGIGPKASPATGQVLVCRCWHVIQCLRVDPKHSQYMSDLCVESKCSGVSCGGIARMVLVSGCWLVIQCLRVDPKHSQYFPKFVC